MDIAASTRITSTIIKPADTPSIVALRKVQGDLGRLSDTVGFIVLWIV
jgi:hypothetical protein